MVLSLAATLVLAAPTVVLEFVEPREVAIVGEGLQPGSATRLEVDPGGERGTVVRLDYEFIAEPDGLQYAGFRTDFTFPARPGQFYVWVRGDGRGQSVRLRLIDAGGETHQFTLGSTNFTGWRLMACPIGLGGEHWGGDGNGILDEPIRFDSLLVDQSQRPATDTVWFSSLLTTPYEPAVDPLGEITRAAGEEGARPADLNRFAIRPLLAGEVLDLGAQPTVVVSYAGAADAGASAEIALLGPDGAVVGRQPLAAVPAPGAEQSVTLPALPRYGLYRAVVQWTVGGDMDRASTTLAALPPMPAETDVDTNLFGACFHFAQHKGELPRNYDLFARIGGRWVRDEYGWGGVERVRGEYNFTEYGDDYVRGIRAAGLRGFYIFDYGNGLYDEGNSPASDEAQEAFTGYAVALNEQYRADIRHWEVWNEPNIGFWKPEPDAAAYARLLNRTYDAVKAVDPEAVIVGLCTAGVDLKYIEEVFEAGGTRMDALSVHPYRYPASPDAAGFVADLQKTRALMAQYGLGEAPLWLTEVGWPNQADGRGVSEETSGNYLVRMFTLARSQPHMGPIFWYDFQNDGTDPAYNEDNFGLINLDFTPKQPFVAAAMMNRVLLDKAFTRDLALPYPAAGHEYTAADGRGTLVLWATPVGAEVDLVLDAAEVEISDASGRLETVAPVGGRLTVEVGETPVFVSGTWGQVTATVRLVGVD